MAPAVRLRADEEEAGRGRTVRRAASGPLPEAARSRIGIVTSRAARRFRICSNPVPEIPGSTYASIPRWCRGRARSNRCAAGYDIFPIRAGPKWSFYAGRRLTRRLLDLQRRGCRPSDRGLFCAGNLGRGARDRCDDRGLCRGSWAPTPSAAAEIVICTREQLLDSLLGASGG